MSTIQQTYLDNSTRGNRSDLIRENFDKLIIEKGQRVLVESALQCPCKGKDVNQLSTCKNCGGTGWTFVNARETRMVVQGMDSVVKFGGWSEELRGMVRISCLFEEELSFMDKLTVIEGEAIHNEVLTFKTKNGTLFAYAAYPIRKILYVAQFDGPNNKYRPLELGVDFTIVQGNAILLSNAYSEPVTITMRYKYAPTFHVLEMRREVMMSYKLEEGSKETNQNFPLSAYGRRAHYILNAPNLTGDRLLNNDFDTACVDPKTAVQRVLIEMDDNLYDFYAIQGVEFAYTIAIVENGMTADVDGRIYTMEVRDEMGVLITSFTIANGGIVVTLPNLVRIFKTEAQTLALPKGIFNYQLKEEISSVVNPILLGKFIVS